MALAPEVEGLWPAIRQADAGDGTDLGRWMERAYPLVVAAFRALTHAEATAESLAGDLLEKAVEAVREGFTPRSEGAWLAVVGKRLFIDEWRRKRRQDKQLGCPPL